MKKKVLFALALFASFFAFCGTVDASEVINVSNETEYFDALSTIKSSSETEFVINFTDDVTLTTSPSSDQVTLSSDKKVTMIGNGHTLKISSTGSYGYRPLLNVGSGVTIVLGKEDGSDTLNIEGGGTTVSTSESLFNVSGTVNFYDGVSIGNNHSGNGSMAGGAFDLNTNGTVNMYGGRIHDNSSTGACLGGAVMIDDSNTTFNMYGGIIENNSVCDAGSAYGGAIAIYDGSQTAVLNIEGGTFKNNSALYGGAIANIYGNLTIKNAIFEGNKAATTREDEEPSGGAIVQYSMKPAIIENTTFKNNSARLGGAIHDFAISVTVKNSTFEGNKADVDGGAIFVDPYRGDLTSIGNTFINNEAQNGGAINNGRKLSSTDDIIKNNKATTGAGIYAAGTINTINSDIYNNKATEAANDIFISADATNLDIKDPSTIDATVTFADGVTNITGWFSDAANGRFTVTNPTDAVDTITAGNEYALTAAGEETTIEYEVIKGAEQTYTIDENENAVFEINADYSVFENGGKVYVDGKEVSNDNYTSKSGSTIITFKKTYMDGLSVGEHTLKVIFTDGGSATTTFTVADTEAIVNPQTGDGIVKYMIVLIVAMAGLVGFGIYRKKANK